MPNQRIRGNQITDPRTITQNEHDEKSDSKRVLIVDENGNPINESNPLPTNATFEGSLSVELDPQNDGVHLGDKVTGETAEVDADRRLRVFDSDAQLALQEILTQLQSGTLSVGTEDGTLTGVQRVFVNNRYLQILAAQDRDQDITYADFGTKNQRILQIDYVAPSIGTGVGFTARKVFTYVLDGGKYKRTKITRQLV